MALKTIIGGIATSIFDSPINSGSQAKLTDAGAGTSPNAFIGTMGKVLPFAGIAMGLLGGISQARTNRHIAKFNSAMAKLRERDARLRGQIAMRDSGMRQRQFMGRQRAHLAASGVEVDSGSAAEIQEDAQYWATMDQMQIASNASREAFGHRMDSSMIDVKANAERTQQMVGAIGGAATSVGRTILRGRA